MQAWLEANVPHPLDVLRPRLEGLPEAVQVKLAEMAYEDARRWPPSIDDDASWTYFTMGRGRPYFVYLVLSKANPQVTEQEAARLSERMDPETFTRLGMLASGKDPDDPKTSAPSSALPADTMESPSAGG